MNIQIELQLSTEIASQNYGIQCSLNNNFLPFFSYLLIKKKKKKSGQQYNFVLNLQSNHVTSSLSKFQTKEKKKKGTSFSVLIKVDRYPQIQPYINIKQTLFT